MHESTKKLSYNPLGYCGGYLLAIYAWCLCDGRVERGGVGGEVGYTMHWAKNSHRVLIEILKGPQCTYASSQDGHWQQFYTKCSLISAPHAVALYTP